MNNFRQCKLCGDIYNFNGGAFCNKCIRAIDDGFVTVREYLYRNPDANVENIVEQTEVDERIVLHLLKEGRLEMKNTGGVTGLRCEICGTPISSGRRCKKCQDSLNQQLNQAISKNKQNASPTSKPTIGSREKGMHVDVGRNKK